LVETEVQELPKTGSVCGIDVGLKDFAVLSDEAVYKSLRPFRKLERKLAKEQKVLSRRREQAKKDGRKLSESKNYQKQRAKVAGIHEQISNARTDYLQKISTEIVKTTTSSASRICWFPTWSEPQASKISDSSWSSSDHAGIQSLLVRQAGCCSSPKLSVQPTVFRLRIPKQRREESRRP
jgi:putative transposase